ncbi:MAG: SurA N-terminal domain-containing protein, partial [Methylophilaceae bacterium]|nr:SurA N-terminal domain-containing protein [Methylophilaceae bacterium]
MLEHIRRVAQGWLGKTILAAVTIPFALFGIDFYLNQAGQNVSVAQVNGQKISIQEYTTALQDWRNRIRATGKVQNVDLDAPIFKRLVLNRLVDERLLAQSLQHSGLVMSDAELSRTILQMKEFQKNGQFSQELYDQTLQQNGLTPSKFEARLRRDLLLSELQGGLVNLAQSTQTQQQTSQDLLLQKREVSIASIKASDFLTAAQVGESEVQAFYDKNHEKFSVPEQVKIEFLLLSVNEFLPQVKVDETEVKKAFDDNADKMQGNEERRASHILLAFPKDDAKQKAIARTKAEALLAVLQSDPAQFEALAQKNSQDPGSASKGGDLGRFGRGAMVKPFEDAVFQMKVGQISHLVESEFGYHIIKLTEVSGSRPDFSSLKAQIKADLLLQKAQALFAERAENFNDMVYQQST